MAALSLVIGGWLFWRWPELNREIAAVAAMAQSDAAIPAVADAAGWMVVAQQQTATGQQLALAGQYVAVERQGGAQEFIEAATPLSISPPGIAPDAVAANETVSPAPARPRPQIADPDLADRAYVLLASGQKRAAARKFRDALAAQPNDPRSHAWAAQLRLMETRWSGSAYVFARQSGLGTATAEPVLGGGQSGAQLAYAVDPLALRPLSLITRASTANSDGGTAQVAFGIKWQLLSGLSIAAERLVPVGPDARSAWNLRLAGGSFAETVGPGRSSVEIATYAEAGVVGVRRTDLYAAGTARIGRRLPLGTAGAVVPGLGIWGSVQHADRTVARIEVGPSVQVRLSKPVALSLTGEYRQVITGYARPASGPALTIAASF